MNKRHFKTAACLLFICLSGLQANAQFTKANTSEHCFVLAFGTNQLQSSKIRNNQMDTPFRDIRSDNSGGGKALVITGRILAGVGGGMAGWYLGTKLADEDSDISSGILIGGVVLAATGIVLAAVGAKKINKSLSNTNRVKPELFLSKNYTGGNSYCLGLKIFVK